MPVVVFNIGYVVVVQRKKMFLHDYTVFFFPAKMKMKCGVKKEKRKKKKYRELQK